MRLCGKHCTFDMPLSDSLKLWSTRTMARELIVQFLRDLTHNRIRRSVFQDLERLITAIGDYIDAHHQNPKPFTWTARANDILEKVARVNKRRSA